MARSSVLALIVLSAFVGSGCQGSTDPPVGTSIQTLDTLDPDGGAEQCTWTIGYWKNHADAWPVGMLALGDVLYTRAQLLEVLGQPVNANGLVSLAHQLIAAKLNVAAGALDLTGGAIADADTLIGNLVVPPFGSGRLEPSATSATGTVLDDFNNGLVEGACATGFCGDGIVEPELGEQCDDGNDPSNLCIQCVLDDDGYD